MHNYHGIIGLIVLFLDLWAIISIISSGRSVLAKVCWTLAVLILPVLGFFVWLFAGPRGQ